MESKTISLYMCRGNRIHILNCKKTTTKGGPRLNNGTQVHLPQMSVFLLRHLEFHI